MQKFDKLFNKYKEKALAKEALNNPEKQDTKPFDIFSDELDKYPVYRQRNPLNTEILRLRLRRKELRILMKLKDENEHIYKSEYDKNLVYAKELWKIKMEG